jgi:hypothetical protein
VSVLVPDIASCDACWVGICPDHDGARRAFATPANGVPMTETGYAVAQLIAERDALKVDNDRIRGVVAAFEAEAKRWPASTANDAARLVLRQLANAVRGDS